MAKQNRKHKFIKKLGVFLAIVILLSAVGCYCYVSDYYHADATAQQAINEPSSSYTVEEGLHDALVFRPVSAVTEDSVTGNPNSETGQTVKDQKSGAEQKAVGEQRSGAEQKEAEEQKSGAEQKEAEEQKSVTEQTSETEQQADTEPQADTDQKTSDSGTTTGLIFYPGGKVEYTAYAPLMALLAQRGVLCILVKMPCNLAILGMNAAGEYRDAYPEITNWYIGGHSLGGAAACMYLKNHVSEYDGLILLGSYSTKDLSSDDLEVLCVYGENDGVMNRTKYEDLKTNLPSDYEELVITGGCHAYFGDYGFQKGDGTPTITPEEQQEQTADAILEIINHEE